MNVAPYIDHTILKPTTVFEDIEKLCSEARRYRFAAVCVPPLFVRACKGFMDGNEIKVATVIGFPFGYSTTKAKLAEAEQALIDDADELDIVINLSHVKSGNWRSLEIEMKELSVLAHSRQAIVKVIIESGTLTDDEII